LSAKDSLMIIGWVLSEDDQKSRTSIEFPDLSGKTPPQPEFDASE